MRRIVAITGIRSEYDILYPVLKAVNEHQRLDLKVVVTGAHCADMFGRTERLVENDGFPVAERIESLLNANTAGSRVKSAGIQLTGLAQTIERLKPDFILVAGDREEALTGAMCGAYMNIAVAHMCGGDYAVGNVDDSVRHAVTKLAHLHFPMSELSRRRILRLGESPWRVHCVGNPALDRLRTTPKISRAELSRRLGFDVERGPLLVVLQHVISSEMDDARRQMTVTMRAASSLGCKCVIIYPNSDAGSGGIGGVIEEWLPKMPFAGAFRNLPREEFVNLLRSADCLVGNSSLGILEAPFLKLPVVNIGNRQKGREHAGNVIFVPHDVGKITKAVRRALEDRAFRMRVQKCANPFGDGHAGRRIARILSAVETGKKLLVKEMTF